jgi:coenzyme F420-0:L-glutamate ligase/coenzyme F420-1:gamma-L-glutamate ligase
MAPSESSSVPRPRTSSGDHGAVTVPAFLEARRSIRSFAREPVARPILDALVEAACIAPAPHHSRPWRWVVIDSPEAKVALAEGMGARWRADLAADGIDDHRITELVDASYAKLTGAPALLLGCLTWDGLDRYPDQTRQLAEWGMALLSLGASVENLMLSAADAGLASCWVAAPIFCPNEARAALDLDADWSPQALVLVGHPDAGYVPRERPPVVLDGLRAYR